MSKVDVGRFQKKHVLLKNRWIFSKVPSWERSHIASQGTFEDDFLLPRWDISQRFEFSGNDAEAKMLQMRKQISMKKFIGKASNKN